MEWNLASVIKALVISQQKLASFVANFPGKVKNASK
jgi:hypothetical protein